MAAMLPVILTKVGVSAATAATIGTIASVGLTAASAFSSIQAGNAEANSLNLAARQSDLNARAERLEGRRQSLSIQDQLARDLASQNAIFAARGGLQGEGSASAAQAKAEENASNDIDLALFNTDIAALNAEQRASNNRANAKSAKSSGALGAIKAIGGFRPVSAPKQSLLPGLD